jgi:hypothetical protein
MGKFRDWFDGLSDEQKAYVAYCCLKSLSLWDVKRVLCNVFEVDSYMDDEGLRKALERVVNER